MLQMRELRPQGLSDLGSHGGKHSDMQSFPETRRGYSDNPISILLRSSGFSPQTMRRPWMVFSRWVAQSNLSPEAVPAGWEGLIWKVRDTSQEAIVIPQQEWGWPDPRVEGRSTGNRWRTNLLGDNSPQVSWVSVHIVSKALLVLDSRLSFQRCLYGKQLWKIWSSSRAKGKYAYCPT